MSEGYKLKIHPHSPMAAKQLIKGTGLIKMLGDMISSARDEMSDSSFMKVNSPLKLVEKADFDLQNPIVIRFFDNNNLSDLISEDSHSKLVKCYDDLNSYRLSELRKNLRSAYNSLQNATNKDNEAVKLERIASKLPEKSSGYWQVESLKNLDNSLIFSDTETYDFINTSRNLILAGDKYSLESAGELIKIAFENITPTSNTRLAYTTLSTQDNEPYLLCPKGQFNGRSSAVPMEVSKCRENCIDSRVATDGTVSCAYQDWLKVSFEPQNKVLGRLDVHRHPDNEQNLNLAENERSKKLTDGEFGYEYRLNHSTQGANKIRNSDKNFEDSIEKQLSDKKSSEWGHVSDDKPKMAPKQAQSDATRTVDNQLQDQRKDQKGNEFLEELLRKLNYKEFDAEKTIEENLISDGLQAHRGESQESLPTILNNKKSKPLVRYVEELNKFDKETNESISNQLNKTAKKNDIRGLNDTLDQSRKDVKGDKTREESLQDSRHKNPELKKTREELLAGLEKDDWGHQYSDEEFEGFMKDMGLDSKLEDLRNEFEIGK
jgi:hypothetical protein